MCIYNSLYLSDYVSGSRDRLIVTLLNRDVQYPSMPVRLRLTVKGNGFSVQTRPYAAVTPIVLEPNVPYRLTISDLQPYFDTRNLSAQGLGGDSYLKGGRLPEGMIEFGIEVLEYGTGKLLSQKGIGTAWLVLQKPPQLSLPFDGEVIPWREPLNLLFQWTPQHSAVGRVEYELVIKELWDNGLAAESAFAYSPEIFRERISSTSYLYGPQSPPLEAGHRYAWAVQVVAKDGVDDVSIFENEGKSVVRSFRIDRNCPVPAQIKAGVERGYIAVEWEGAPEHIGYMVSYRLSGSEEWTDVRSTFPSAMLSGVRPGNTYEYRVAGFCEPEVPTYNNTTASITLPSEDTVRMKSCGLLRPVDLSNQQPLEELSAGDQFMAGDFPVTVTEVTGSQGYYTGTGSVNVPFLAGAKFKVAFDHIFLNTDRRMVRGTVNTVYDATESGITNLDDIFVGGSETGKVMAGITKTDLSADFVIDKDADVYFDESENQIIVKGDDGQVIGYIDVGEAGMEREEAGGNNGNEPSVFPMTIKDKEGNLYRVDKAPEDVLPEGEEAGENTGQATARPPKKLVVTPLGKSGEKLSTDDVDLKRLDSDVAEVVFTDVEGSRYAFDGWKDVYARSILIRQKYEQVGSSYHVASKLLPPGKSDRVGAEIRLKDQSLDPEKVVFRTAQGTEFQVESFDRKKGRYVLTLVGGDTNDGQEVYALYPKAGGGYYNLGKLLVVSYPEYKFRVKIVPLLRDFGGDFPSLKSMLESVYSRVGIGCEVTLDAYFEYADPLLFDKGSGLLSAYNGKMKALNEAYASSRGVEKEVSYIFITGYSGGSGKRDFSGFMPLNTQFGYVSRYDFRSLDKFCIAVAHELAHGRFSLRHPFDSSLGLDEGDVSENLMDYRNGRELSKWQWDIMHDPGVVVRLFERDQDGMIVVDRNKNTIRIRWSNCPPQMVGNKKLLLYDGVCADTKENVTYYRLVNDGGIVACYQDNSVELTDKYSVSFDKKTWMPLLLSAYEDDCLSCELTHLLGEMVTNTGKFLGTFVVPAEDLYILISGEDFDGEEASRIAAGGFLVLEAVQVGKVMKFVKGGKILAKGGIGVDMSVRVFKQFVKKTAEDAVIDLSAQFIVNFVSNALLYPSEDGYCIAERALLGVKLQDAIVGGMIDYASFDTGTKMAFDCALRMTSSINKGGCTLKLSSITEGVQDCMVHLGITMCFRYFRKTAEYKAFYEALKDARSYDIILDKLSDIVSKETVENFIQTLLENGIQAGTGNTSKEQK